MKRLIRTVFIYLAISALTATVLAADYASPPDYEPPEKIKPVIGNISIEDFKEILKQEEPVFQISGEEKYAVITKEMLSEIAKSGKTVMFEAKDYVLKIDAKDITDSAKSIDLTMKIGNDKIDGERGDWLVITPAAKGEFGFAVTLIIPAAHFKTAEIDFKAENLKAFHIDDNDIITKYQVTAHKDGSAEIKFSGASRYVITEADLIGLFSDEILGEELAELEFLGEDIQDLEFPSHQTPYIMLLSDIPSDDPNTKTGVTLAFTAFGISGLAALAAKKFKNG